MGDTAYSGKDRRRFPRLRLRLAVIYQVNKPLTLRLQIGNKEIISTALDLGEGGMAISTYYDIPLEAELLIKLTLFKIANDGRVSFSGPMEIGGQVRSNVLVENKMHRLGIFFTHIEPKDKVEIINFVKSA